MYEVKRFSYFSKRTIFFYGWIFISMFNIYLILKKYLIGSAMNYVSWLLPHKYGTSHETEEGFADISNLFERGNARWNRL